MIQYRVLGEAVNVLNLSCFVTRFCVLVSPIRWCPNYNKLLVVENLSSSIVNKTCRGKCTLAFLALSSVLNHSLFSEKSQKFKFLFCTSSPIPLMHGCLCIPIYFNIYHKKEFALVVTFISIIFIIYWFLLN